MGKQEKRINVLDLFSGCGWLSEGFFNEGYEFVGHVEMDSHACESLKTRTLFHFLKKNGKLDEYEDYLSGGVKRDAIVEKYNLENEVSKVINAEVSDETYPPILERIRKNLKGGKLDVLVGWPPCQTYSQIGRSRVGSEISKDPRNFLYKQYVKFLKDLKPEVFVFENVPGLKSAWGGKYLADIESAIRDVWYVMEVRAQYMPDYGIPQNRKRLIIVWWKSDSRIIKAYPDLSGYLRPDYEYSVGDFLKDLPIIDDQAGQRPKMPYAGDNQILETLWIRDIKSKNVYSHETRPIRELDKAIYKIAAKAYAKWKKLHYGDLPQELRTHKNTTGFFNRFNVVAWNDKVTSTVVAHISKDWHYYIHPDTKQNRSLSIREAARIQTFPDSFKFEWPRTAAFRQIGNAVPPMFANIIAKELKKYFQ